MSAICQWQYIGLTWLGQVDSLGFGAVAKTHLAVVLRLGVVTKSGSAHVHEGTVDLGWLRPVAPVTPASVNGCVLRMVQAYKRRWYIFTVSPNIMGF